METIDLSWLDLGLIYSLLVIPLAMMLWLRVGEIRDILVAVVRMTVQLWLVGLYLKVIFDFNALWLNTLWILAMLTVANTSMLKQARLVYRRFFVVTFLGTAA